jgi:hypothetical protein
MEELLELYEQPYNPAEPVVGFDECSLQLLGEVRHGLRAEPAQPRRVDYEYERRGTTNLLVLIEPLAGWRDVEVSTQRTKTDFARRMAYLVEERYPDAERIHVVLDNLNTHTKGALYEAFPAPRARQIARKLVFHSTPVHGSWLNKTEIEISVLSRQCLSRRIPDEDTLRSIIGTWQAPRNEQRATIDWRFTVDKARDKFHRFYPHDSL